MTYHSGNAAARWSAVAGALALAVAILGALASFLAAPATLLSVLTVLVWVVAALGLVGLVLGLVAGAGGPGRSGVLMSATALVLLGLFLGYSSFSAPAPGTGGPAPVTQGG